MLSKRYRGRFGTDAKAAWLLASSKSGCHRVNSNILKRANFLILSHTFIFHLFCFAARSFFFLIFSCFFLINSWYRAALHDK